MGMSGQVVVHYNHIPQTRVKMTAESVVIVRKILDEVASAIESASYYPETECRIDMTGARGGNVLISPWWMGFVEFGAAHRGARPFAGRAADGVFKSAEAQFKAIEGRL